MEAQNQSNSINLLSDKFRSRLFGYTDSIIRGLISFGVVSIGLYLLLIVWLEMNKTYFFPAVFIVAVILAPVFSKIKVGEFLWTKYEKWLEKIFR